MYFKLSCEYHNVFTYQNIHRMLFYIILSTSTCTCIEESQHCDCYYRHSACPIHVHCKEIMLGGDTQGTDVNESILFILEHKQTQFVQTELCGEPSLGGQQACWSSDKSTRFHQTDKQITSLELWTNWHKNEGM